MQTANLAAMTGSAVVSLPNTISKSRSPSRSALPSLRPRLALVDQFELIVLRSSPSSSNFSNHTKLRIDNLHYDLTENDLSSLFSQLAPLPVPPTIRYDRAGRSTGVAFISYSSIAAARKAIREFDGANANGQPIYLTLVSAGADRTTGDRPGSRNPFETARMPLKSLFERVSSTRPLHSDDDNEDRQQDMPFEDDDLAAPSVRHSDVSGPAPKGIDRYIPGRHSQNSRRSRSPRERRTGHSGSGDSAGRRPGTRRETHNRDGTQRNDRSGTGNTKGGNQRPRKTQDELDREMDDYWVGGRGNGDGGSESLPATSNGHEAVTTVETEEDIDMGIE